jgi:type III secretion protein L
MLAKRTLELRRGDSTLSQPYLSRETLAACGRAEAVIEHAERYADDVREQAQQDRDALLKSAQMEFWGMAEAKLAEWERERQAMLAQIEATACHVVNAAITTLLDEVPDERRIAAVIQQIARLQSEPVAATIRCHPEDLASLSQSLEDLGERPWKVAADRETPRHCVRLTTDGGDFQLDWDTAVRRLLLPDGSF